MNNKVLKLLATRDQNDSCFAANSRLDLIVHFRRRHLGIPRKTTGRRMMNWLRFGGVAFVLRTMGLRTVQRGEAGFKNLAM